MDLKKMSPWLKGGLAGLLIAIIITISISSIVYEQVVYDGCHEREQPGDDYSQCDLIDSQMQSSVIASQYRSGFYIAIIIILLVISIPLFLLGSIVGLVVGKLVGRK